MAAAATTTLHPPPQVQKTRFIEIERERHWCVRFITLIVRVWGLITSAALWAGAIKLLDKHDLHVWVGWYLLALAIVVTFLELMWIMNKCNCCEDGHGCCCCIWRGLLWIDNWRKTILYGLAVAPCFVYVYLIGVICGIFLIVAAILYLIKSFKDCHCTKKGHTRASFMEVTSPQVSLVQHEVTQPTDDKPITPEAADSAQPPSSSYQNYDK